MSWLTHHDEEDARQDGMIAAWQQDQLDNRPYVFGCIRNCRYEVARQNGRWNRNLDAWRDAELCASRHAGAAEDEHDHRNMIEADRTLYLVPYYRVDVLHGDDYREHLRAQQRAAYARRKAA